MIEQKTLDFCLDQLRQAALEQYNKSEESALLREKLEQMDRDCNGMLTEDQRDFIEECFELLADVHGRRAEFLYRRGMRDGVQLLKTLGICA